MSFSFYSTVKDRLDKMLVNDNESFNSQNWFKGSLAAVRLRLLHTDRLIHGLHLATKKKNTHSRLRGNNDLPCCRHALCSPLLHGVSDRSSRWAAGHHLSWCTWDLLACLCTPWPGSGSSSGKRRHHQPRKSWIPCQRQLGRSASGFWRQEKRLYYTNNVNINRLENLENVMYSTWVVVIVRANLTPLWCNFKIVV